MRFVLYHKECWISIKQLAINAGKGVGKEEPSFSMNGWQHAVAVFSLL